MKIEEMRQNLFDLNVKYYLGHCISSDFAMGAGIAVEFEKRFNLRKEFAKYESNELKHPTCILQNAIFNLITKERYWHKPTYETLREALEEMRRLAILNDISYIGLPRIGAGLDQLEWAKVRQIIKTVFQEDDIDIVICYL